MLDQKRLLREMVEDELSGNKMIARFNLGAGENFMKWRIYPKGGGEESAKYYDPETVSFVFHNAYLRNQCSTANKIYGGANKSVCAWIEFDRMEKLPSDASAVEGLTPVNYNPKIAPNWVVDGHNADGTTYSKLITFGRKPYILEP